MIQNCQPLPVHRPACPESSLAEATFTTNCFGLINPPSKVSQLQLNNLAPKAMQQIMALEMQQE